MARSPAAGSSTPLARSPGWPSCIPAQVPRCPGAAGSGRGLAAGSRHARPCLRLYLTCPGWATARSTGTCEQRAVWSRCFHPLRARHSFRSTPACCRGRARTAETAGILPGAIWRRSDRVAVDRCRSPAPTPPDVPVGIRRFTKRAQVADILPIDFQHPCSIAQRSRGRLAWVGARQFATVQVRHGRPTGPASRSGPAPGAS